MHEWSQEWVVEGLASLFQLDVEPVIELLELVAAELAEHLPAGKAVLITRLKTDHIFLRGLLKGLILIEPLLSSLIESLKITDVRLLLNEVREVVIELLYQHSKLCSPVTHVVDSLHIVTKELEDSANAISLNGGPQVTDVHVFGNVRTGKVNQHGWCFLSLLTLGFFFLGYLSSLLSVFQGHVFANVDVVDALVHELVLQEDIKIKS